MRVGQRVMKIAFWVECEDMTQPPLGAVGTITEPIDEGDYYVLFDDYPFPRPEDPDREWYAPHWALVPIDELPGPSVLIFDELVEITPEQWKQLTTAA